MRWIRLALIGMALGCSTPPEGDEPDATLLQAPVEPVRYDDPAAFLPSDVQLFAHMEKAHGFIDADDQDPVTREAWSVIEALVPEEFRATVAAAFEIEEAELLRQLFSEDLTIVEQPLEERTAVILLSRPPPELLERLPAAADLRQVNRRSDDTFTFYHGDAGEKHYRVAISDRWLAFALPEDATSLRHVLSVRDRVETLDTDAAYRDVVSRLPKARHALLFTQSRERNEHHALTIERAGNRLEVLYAAKSPEVEKYVEPRESTAVVDFGPLPANVVAAGTIGVLTDELPRESTLDLLLVPVNIREHVLPKISPPIVVFLGSLPRSSFELDPGFTVPVVGIAIRLKDPSVAEPLDHICSRLHFLSSVGRLALAEGFFGIRPVTQRGLDYHVADFGPVVRATSRGTLLERLASLPASSALTRVTYGRIGEYYVVCSNETFFHDWQRTTAGHAERLDAADDFKDFEFETHDGLIFSGLTRGQALAALLREAAEFVRKSTGDEEVEKAVEAEKSAKAEKRATSRIEQPLRWIADGLKQSVSFSFQVWHGDDGYLRGRMVVLQEADVGEPTTPEPKPDSEPEEEPDTGLVPAHETVGDL